MKGPNISKLDYDLKSDGSWWEKIISGWIPAKQSSVNQLSDAWLEKILPATVKTLVPTKYFSVLTASAITVCPLSLSLFLSLSLSLSWHP